MENRGESIEKLCLFIALLDKEANGSIECRGEDNEDIWRIVIKGGKVFIERAEIVYSDGEEFNDIEPKKQVYKITKDKNLLKEIMLDELK